MEQLNEQQVNEQQQVNEEQTTQGWRDVQISTDIPLSAIVQFVNILNQRICTLEDTVTIKGVNGEDISITEIYRLQTEADLKAQQEAQNNQPAEESQGK